MHELTKFLLFINQGIYSSFEADYKQTKDEDRVRLIKALLFRFVSLKDELSSRVMDELNQKDRDSLLAEIRNLRTFASKTKGPHEQVE